MSKIEISRRKLLKIGLTIAVSGILPCESMAAVRDYLSRDRRICFYNLHTKEHMDVTYWKDGEYVKEAMSNINYIFRDHYNGRKRSIDPKLIDFLYSIQQKVGTRDPFHLISGYRSRQTNDLLRKNNRKVARHSQHIHGKAADIRLPDRGLKTLRRAAYELRGGGVGYYPRSNFIHVDVGPVRFWRG